MSRYEHIIWDWNGTLFDDAWLCRAVVSRMLEARGRPALTEKRYMEIFDFPVKNYYELAGFDFTLDPYDLLAAEFIDEYERRRHECSLRDGVRESLKKLAAKGLSQSILSAYSKNALEDVVSFFGIRQMFSYLYGLDNFYAAGKTDIGKKMMADAALNPSGAILIGDTTHDFYVARAMGVRCILIPGGHHSLERLEQTGAMIAASPVDAADCILA